MAKKSPVIAITITADDKSGKGFKSAEAHVSGLGKNLSGAAVAVGTFAGTLAARAVPAAIDFGKELFNVGQAAETMSKKADTVFGSSSADIKQWADGINESLGISDERVVGLAASMGDLLVPLGFSREAAAEMTKTSLDAAGALAAWSGGQYDAAQVSDIMTKAMLGEREGLKGLGISINQAEVDERALAIARKEGRDEITAQDKALATQALILEKSADAQTAWSDGTMDSIKAQNELSATIDDVKTDIGKALVPMVQKAVQWITGSFIPAIKSLIAEFKEKWPQIKAAVQPTLDWFVETVQTVWTVIETIWNTYGDNILEFTRAVFGPIKQVIEGVMTAIKGVIDLVLGILTGDWDKAWNGIKDIFTGVWNVILGQLKLIWAQIKLVFSVALETIKNIVKAAWQWVKDITGKLLSGYVALTRKYFDLVVGIITGLPGRIASTISGLWDGLKLVTTAAKDWVKDRITDVVGIARGLPGRLSGIFHGMWDGIKIAFKAALNAIISGWNRIEFKIPGFKIGPVGYDGFTLGVPDIPHLARGGIVRARPGGIIANIGEGRYDEAVIPLSPGNMSTLNRGPSTVNYITQNFPAGVRPSDVIDAQRRWERRNGAA